jgi:hypothetical protein
VSGVGEKMGSILPGSVIAGGQTHISFVNQRSGLESVTRAFLPHVRSGHSPQFLVDERDQLIGSLLVPLAELSE